MRSSITQKVGRLTADRKLILSHLSCIMLVMNDDLISLLPHYHPRYDRRIVHFSPFKNSLPQVAKSVIIFLFLARPIGFFMHLSGERIRVEAIRPLVGLRLYLLPAWSDSILSQAPSIIFNSVTRNQQFPSVSRITSSLS